LLSGRTTLEQPSRPLYQRFT